MSLFRKNPNEVAYTGGKKHWTDVIKNSGRGDLLIWRQPEEDFNTNSTLIVMPGEEAIFVKGGNIEEVFTNGTYKLTTENYPFISRLRNAFSGGISTFNCVVYFVRTAHSVEIKWGTTSPVQVRDKLLGIATTLRGRGSYKVAVEQPAKFLMKLVGNNVPPMEQEDLEKYFVNEFQSKIKSVITRALNETPTELLGIEGRLDEFSETLMPFMQDILNDYGLKCVNFNVAALTIADDELRRKYDEIGMDAIAKLRNAQADRAVMDILGEDWGKQQAANILSTLAENPGGSDLASAGAGVGMGLAAGGAFGAMAQQMFAPMNHGSAQNGADQKEDPLQVLTKLKAMLDAGVITQADYDAKKKEVMDRM